MKRIINILAMTLCVMLFVSCKKSTENEWQRFWGFTKDDIAGHYNANPDESLYEELPTEGIKVYDNATMDITGGSGNNITLQITIPGTVNKTFSGVIYSSDDNSDIVLENGNHDIRMTVYKNDENNVRFHGRVQQFYINSNNQRVNLHTYGFDVIKEE